MITLCVSIFIIDHNAVSEPPNHANWVLTFADEFNEKLSPAVWNHYEGSRKDGFNVKKNAFIENGNLVLRVSKGPFGRYHTGFISTRRNHEYMFSQKYGYFEARIKFGTGGGHWAAFWLMPDPGKAIHNKDNSGRDGAEIDIAEGFGASDVNHAVHFDGYNYGRWGKHQSVGFNSVLDANEWHTYGLEWTPNALIWYIDDQEVHRLDSNSQFEITGKYVSDANRNSRQIRFTEKSGIDFIPQIAGYLQLTTEVMNGGWAGKIDRKELPVDTLVDYVRVYQNFEHYSPTYYWGIAEASKGDRNLSGEYRD